MKLQPVGLASSYQLPFTLSNSWDPSGSPIWCLAVHQALSIPPFSEFSTTFSGLIIPKAGPVFLEDLAHTSSPMFRQQQSIGTYGISKRIISETTNYSKDTAFVHIGAATTACFATSSFTNPLFFIKTRLQLDPRVEKPGCGKGSRYKNGLDCIFQIGRQESFEGMYWGLIVSYIGSAESVLHLTLYKQLKNLMSRREEKRSGEPRKETTLDHMVDWACTSGAEGFSKFAAIVVGYPHEVSSPSLRGLDSTALICITR